LFEKTRKIQLLDRAVFTAERNRAKDFCSKIQKIVENAKNTTHHWRAKHFSRKCQNKQIFCLILLNIFFYVFGNRLAVVRAFIED
jgi:hypothetical protein